MYNVYGEKLKKAPNLIWNYLVTNSKMADYFNFVWLPQNISSLPGDRKSTHIRQFFVQMKT